MYESCRRCSCHHRGVSWFGAAVGTCRLSMELDFHRDSSRGGFCDGFAARLLHAYSSLGKELDSLCDLVSFGVGPSLLIFNCMTETSATPWLAWMVFLIPVCGALRLARFNVDDRQTTSFIGLPIPANAIFWIGYSALAYQNVDFLTAWYCFLPILVVESWLMVSPVHFSH